MSSSKIPADHEIEAAAAAWAALDPEQGVFASTQVFAAVEDGRLNPVQKFPLFVQSAEAQFDAPGGKPARVLRALEAARPAFREAELDAIHRAGGSLTAPQRHFWRHQPLFLLARTLHVLPDTARLSLEVSYGNLEYLIEQAEMTEDRLDITDGIEVMIELLRSPVRARLAEEAVAALSIHMATIRRNRLKDPTLKRLIKTCRTLTAAYVLDDEGELRENLMIYPKTEALAAQGFYFFKQHGTPEDNNLVQALYELDLLTRATHPRSKMTSSLRDMEYAAYRGDLAEMERYCKQAHVDLALLPRHSRRFDEEGWPRAA